MKRSVATFLIVVAGFATQTPADQTPPLRLLQTIPLAHVKGRIDHLAIDLYGQRLFVAALGNDTVEVVDLQARRQSRTLTGFHEPQSVAFLPGLNQLIVTNGGDGRCQVLDDHSLAVIHSIQLSSDADNVRYDAENQKLYVGYGHGALDIIDASSEKHVGDIALDGHPESFQLERTGSRVFVNIPDVHQIAVVDRQQQRVITRWPTTTAHANFPMALDETNHRLFVGFRTPAKLLVFDTESGTVVSTLDSVGDADDIFYDAQRKRLYISGGEGFIQVIEQLSANAYHTVAKVATASGARTSLFVPELNQLFVAVPHRGSQTAEVRVYAIQP